MKTALLFPAVLSMGWLAGCASTAHSTGEQPMTQRGDRATGSFAPTGPPRRPPVRIDAGGSCVVDVEQGYSVSGTLSGSFEIDFRILVSGPCGSPSGAFDEEWIAHGRFTGTTNGSSTAGSFSYVATVQTGGDVEGIIVLGQGLEGGLSVHGSFGEGRLSYEGWVEVGPHNKPMRTDQPTADR